MNAYQPVNLLVLPVGAAFALGLTLRLADAPGPFGQMCGDRQYSLVQQQATYSWFCDDHDGCLAESSSSSRLAWLAAAIWIRSINSDSDAVRGDGCLFIGLAPERARPLRPLWMSPSFWARTSDVAKAEHNLLAAG